jgi:hypothetical protein
LHAQDSAVIQPRAVPSPCRNICRLKRGLCVGCGRTGGEIEAWPRAPDTLRREIVSNARRRLEKLNGAR